MSAPRIANLNFRAGAATILCILLFASLCVNAYFMFFQKNFGQIAAHIPLPLGYQPFEFPRDFGPQSLIGAIVTIGPKSGFSYTYHLSKCGIDATALLPQEGVIALPTISWTYSGSGSASAKIGGKVGGGVEGRSGDQFTINLLRPKELFVVSGDVLSDALIHAAELKRLCGTFLSDKNTFWIPQAIVCDELEIVYSTTSSGGASIRAQASEAIKSFASAKLGIKGEGEFTEKSSIKYKGNRIYIGFREALPIELLTGQTHSFSGNEDATSLPLGDFIYSDGYSR
jgi:hypothetical protein